MADGPILDGKLPVVKCKACGTFYAVRWCWTPMSTGEPSSYRFTPDCETKRCRKASEPEVVNEDDGKPSMVPVR